MTIKLGINPLTWTNDDMPSLGAETPLEVCLAEGKQAGYTGFELGNKFPRDPAVLKPIMQSADLEIVSGWFSGNLLTQSVEQEIAAVQPHLTLLKAMGSKVMVYCEVTGCIHGEQSTPLSHRPRLTEVQWQEFTSKLNDFADYLLSEGVQLAYHHHMGTLIETAEEVDQLMERTRPSVGLLLDTGHLSYAKADPIAVAKKHINRIVHVHCKDVRAKVLADAQNRDVSFLDAVLNGVFTVPGDGCVDYKSLFELLKAHQYSGWLVVEAEQDPSIAPPLEYATLGANNIKALCQQVQLSLS